MDLHLLIDGCHEELVLILRPNQTRVGEPEDVDLFARRRLNRPGANQSRETIQ
jgi:hypothetical protein